MTYQWNNIDYLIFTKVYVLNRVYILIYIYIYCISPIAYYREIRYVPHTLMIFIHSHRSNAHLSVGTDSVLCAHGGVPHYLVGPAAAHLIPDRAPPPWGGARHIILKNIREIVNHIRICFEFFLIFIKFGIMGWIWIALALLNTLYKCQIHR